MRETKAEQAYPARQETAEPVSAERIGDIRATLRGWPDMPLDYDRACDVLSALDAANEDRDDARAMLDRIGELVQKQAGEATDEAVERVTQKQDEMKSALEFIRDNTGDPIMERVAARALGGEER